MSVNSLPKWICQKAVHASIIRSIKAAGEEFYALVDHTTYRDILIYRKALAMDTEDTLLFTLDSTAVKGQYVILPN